MKNYIWDYSKARSLNDLMRENAFDTIKDAVMDAMESDNEGVFYLYEVEVKVIRKYTWQGNYKIEKVK